MSINIVLLIHFEKVTRLKIETFVYENINNKKMTSIFVKINDECISLMKLKTLDIYII